MKNKHIVTITAFFWASIVTTTAETGTFTLAEGDLVYRGETELHIAEGCTATIIGYALKTGDDVPPRVRDDFQSHILVESDDSGMRIRLIEGVGIIENLTFEGPVRVIAEAEGNKNSLATVTIKVSRSSVPVEFIPNNSVVIPSDVSGDVEIVLERSTDLINWTESDPGVVGRGHDGVFFRMRIKQK